MEFADLHLHTIFSDGTYTPGKLVELAKHHNLDAIALVDHDTVDGIQPALEAAEEKGLEVLAGIELTAEHAGCEIHILGYLVDYRLQAFVEKLSRLKEDRVKRIYQIVEKLNNLGVDLKAESVFGVSGGGSVGRLDVARALLKEGFISSIFEAFGKYIGEKCPAYVLGFRLSVKEAVKLIEDAGGVAVLAHPYSLNNNELIPEFVGYGIRGLEAYYPEHTKAMTRFYLDLAKKYNLLVTGGSDCHGDAKPKVKIGSMKIPYELVEKLKEAKNSR